MRIPIPLAAIAGALTAGAVTLSIWNADEASGQPRPPGPPPGMGGGLPRGPAMGPVGGPPRGMGMPGGMPMAAPRPMGMPMGVPGGVPRPPGGMPGGVPGGMAGAPRPGAIPGGVPNVMPAGPRPGVLPGGPGRSMPPGGPGVIAGPVRPGGPGGMGPAGGPGGVAGPIRAAGGPVGPGGPGGPGAPGGAGPGGRDWPGRAGDLRQLAHSAGLGGLGSLARSGAGAGRSPTTAVNRQALANQANQVRNNFNYNNSDNYFNGDWYGRHRNAWRAAAWASAATAAAYGAASWGDYCGYSGGYGDSGGSGSSGSGGYSSEPVYYDYGSNVVYEGGNVYYNGESVGTQEQYAQQASEIADAGRQARTSEEEEWLSLGVYAMIQGEQVNGNDLFQLAVNKAGVIRGNYYNPLSDTTLPVFGSVDKKTQLAAWTVGERKEPVFEAGIANLTKSETTVLVHFGKDRTQQWTLIRIEQPKGPK